MTTLLNTTTISGTGQSTDVPSGDLSQIAEVIVIVVSVTGTFDLALVADGLTVNSVTVSAPGSYTMVGDVRSTLRLAWTAVASATLSAAFTVTPAYCSNADLTAFGIPERAIEEISQAERTRARLAACSDVHSALSAAYVMPVTEWGIDVRQRTAQLTAQNILDIRGTDMRGADAVVYDAGARARAWLASVTNGRIRPPGIVDSTPEEEEHGLAIVSRAPRRWDL